MPPTDRSDLALALEQGRRRVRGLLSSLYGRPDPATEESLRQMIRDEEAKLAALQATLDAPPTDVPPAPPSTVASTPAAPKGRFLGLKTTGLKVEPTLNMHPLPTGVYHFLDPETDPLLTVKVANESRDIRRVCVKAVLEGLSAEAVRTIEIEPRSEVVLKLLPTLLPDRAVAITEVQRATLHVRVDDFDGKPESHDTYTIVCLARNSSFNAVKRPGSETPVDLTHYYAAWVTPHAEMVEASIRRAADLSPDRQIWGYQGEPDSVARQVEALFGTLKEAGIAYINSVIDFGGAAGQSGQRTRLPRESLTARSANCIDGSVLMASLLEGASLNPALVLVPGHAFVGWEVWDGADEWQFLETTMIGTHSFADACASGQKQYDEAMKYSRAKTKMHKLSDLRRRGIWPME